MSNERTYKVFANVTGLVVFELLFWAAIGGVYLLIKTTVPQFELHQPSAWPALLIAPIVLVFFARHYLWKQRRISQSVDLKLSKTLWPNARPRRSIWKFLVWRTALAFLAMGMLAPKTGTRLKEVEAKGVDIMIALDVSRSMLAEDLGMSRLDLAKRTIERIVGSLDGDRAGLVVFAGDAYVQAPLTLDLAAVKLFLDAIGPEAMPVQGTAIGAAIEQCVASFDPESQASKVIMILTDGENHEDDALARADEAAKLGIKVHAAGMASEAGGPIPEFDRYGRQTGYKEDQNGQPVVSTLDERMLVAMVEAGTGTYVRARSGYVDLSPFLERLENLETGKTTKVAYTDYVHQFPWFFLIGLLLLLMEGLWPLSSAKKAPAVAALLLLFLSGQAGAQTGTLKNGTKSDAVGGTQAMLDRDFAAADSLFGQAEGWKGAAPGQLALNRGLALASSGSDEDAMKAFQRAAALSKDPYIQSDAWNNVGNLLLGGQDVEGAVGAYKEALRLDPTDAETRYNLSLAMAMRQDQQEQQEQNGEQDQENQDGEQDQENQDSEQDQENQDGEQDQENQDGEQDQENQDGEQDQDNQDGEQDQKGDQQNGAQDQQPEPSEPKEGQIQPADAERILDMLERNEAALRTKLQAQENAKRRKGKKTKIEKDW
ncbi:MAG: VWA domain-containing protein [Flavobacteriales bacterium]|nr:VWA domain-containing protein [Flavobacteriales bacterium]